MERRSAARPRWDELPEDLRAAVERMLGAAVARAVSMPGAWSPGSADRLLLADGRRAFVKTASAEVNAHTVRLHRREAEVLALLDGAGAPRLLGTVGHGPWFALAEEDLAGRHPDPAALDDATAALDAVARLPEAGPEARSALGRVEDELAAEAEGWRRLIEDDALGAVPVTPMEAEALDALAGRVGTALAGRRLVHLDLRLDNVLIDPAGAAHLVDWPGAAVGAGWIDALTVVLDVRRLAGPAAAERLLAHPVLAAVPADDVDVLLAVLTAYFFDSARKPPSPGVEAVRGFQRRQGEIALDWLRERRPHLRLGAPGG